MSDHYHFTSLQRRSSHPHFKLHASPITRLPITFGLFCGKGFHDETLPHPRDQFVSDQLALRMLLRPALRIWAWLLYPIAVRSLWPVVWRICSIGRLLILWYRLR